MESIHLKRNTAPREADIALPASKSESNRVLIINAMSGENTQIDNASDARDTQTMISLLDSKDETLDVLDAGTTMRFLTAYLAIGGQERVLTGTKRMLERPIGMLVKSLTKIGANIEYLNEEGFPPLRITPFKRQQSHDIKIKADQSSQFISALLMIAPSLPNGLSLRLEGAIASRPYIQMTLDILSEFGIEYDWNGNSIIINHQLFTPPERYAVESDWSAASYWYSIVALSDRAKIKLLGLRQESRQGDIAIISIMNQLGVMSSFEDDGVLIEKIQHSHQFEYDFSDCPDLAQTVAVICGAKQIPCRMTGLESLKIKETDRIKALKKELKKLNIKFKEVDPKVWEIKSKYEPGLDQIEVETYDDHRMAMAFAPLAVLQNITIKNPSVVNKSYPGFWKDLEKVGIHE